MGKPLQESECFKCMLDKGYKSRDNGCHTAMIKKCNGCGEEKPILPLRHWVYAGNNSELED